MNEIVVLKITLLKMKLSNMKGNVSIGNWVAFSGHLVQPSNLARNECVVFASRDASRKALGVKRPIAFLRSFQCLALICL